MGRPIRMYQADGAYFVTARTIQARFLLRPSEHLNELAGGVLARAVERHDVRLYGYVFASNHVHLLVRARDGVLSRFMQYLLSNLAKKVGRLVDWRGPFWERRFSAEAVLDDAAMEERLKYILAHGVKEGLVRRVQDWPGLSCFGQLIGALRKRCRWFDWDRRWKNGKLVEGGEILLSEKWAEPIDLELAVLPHWKEYDDERRRAAVEAMVSAIEDEGRIAHPKTLGPTGVKGKHPHTRPAAAKRSPRPLCHTKLIELRKMFLATYRSFVEAFREASRRFRAGDFSTPFPAFSFRPSVFESAMRRCLKSV